MTSSLSIAILPYLKTSEEFRFKKLVFRNIEDLSGLSTEAADHLNNLSRVFFLRDQQRLKQISYSIIQRPTEDEWGDEELLKQLKEFQTITTYLYSAPHKIFGNPFLTKEHASLYLCIPKRVPLSVIYEKNLTENVSDEKYPEPDNRGEVNGYEVILNFQSHLWITKGSRIYPPVGHMVLNYSQDLYIDLYHPVRDSHTAQIFSFITSKPKRSQLTHRILTALDWYNRSISMDIEDDVALVYLAIAFECLLNLEQSEKVTTRFSESVNLLLGGLPRLESWLIQFYNARSQIVHKGHTANLMFLAIDDPKKRNSGHIAEYRSLVSVGRQIFQLCLSTIIHGALIADKLNLSSMLFTNQERLEEICKILSKTKGSALERLQAVGQQIRDIDNYRFVNETGLQLNTLMETAQLIVKTYLETNPTNDPGLMALLRDFITTKTETDYYSALSELEAIRNYQRDKQKVDDGFLSTDVFLLLDCVWNYTFMHYYWLKESKEKKPLVPGETNAD